MGFFSWKTADSGESIANAHIGFCRPVYLLQPGGEPPIAEPSYDGYGHFGSVDAFEWLARYNLPEDRLRALTEEEDLRMAGIMLDSDRSHFLDTVTRLKVAIFHDASLVDPTIRFLNVNYAQPLPDFGNKSANEHIESGRFKPMAFEVAFPLKFSFNPKAVYEDLPASKSDPAQGYFYDEDEIAELETAYKYRYTVEARPIVEALRLGAPSVIGYDEQAMQHYHAGWRAAMEKVWALMEKHAGFSAFVADSDADLKIKSQRKRKAR